MIASHIDFLLKVIAPDEEARAAAGEADYSHGRRRRSRSSSRTKNASASSRGPTRNIARPTNWSARTRCRRARRCWPGLLNGLFGEGKKGETRKQQIDGRQLPEYDVVRRYLGPAGMQITSEPDGWFLKGFTLTK